MASPRTVPPRSSLHDVLPDNLATTSRTSRALAQALATSVHGHLLHEYDFACAGPSVAPRQRSVCVRAVISHGVDQEAGQMHNLAHAQMPELAGHRGIGRDAGGSGAG